MTQAERRIFLLQKLLGEQPGGQDISIPQSEAAQKRLLRALMNVRPPKPVPKAFLDIQDAYLQAELAQKGVTGLADLPPIADGLYLWQGDITTLRCDAIVNAANSALLGCFVPCHGCIDNAIHSAAGVQLRLACAALMEEQGHAEPTGQAKLTPAYNLPCKYVLHTVGPIVSHSVTPEDRAQLASCYRACLELAATHRLNSVAFCCISTGEFHFPPEEAERIAIQTVQEHLANSQHKLEVIFNVFQDRDYAIYKRLLG